MAGAMLPPVVTVLEADTDQFMAKIAEVKAAVDGLKNTRINIAVNIDDASLARASAAIAALNKQTVSIGTNVQTSQLRQLASGLNTVATAGNNANRALNGNGNGIGSNGSRRLPGWIGVLASNVDTLHSVAVAVAAIGSALAGAAIGAASYAAVVGPGAFKFGQQAYNTYTGESSQGQGIGSIAGLKTNPYMAAAQAQGYGQTAQLYGGAINYLNAHQGSAIATEGSQVSAGIDQMMAKLNLLKSSGGGNVLGDLNQDAMNLGHTLESVGEILAKAFQASPGELEWLTNGLADVAQVLERITSIPGLLPTFMMLHSLTFLSGGLGKLLSSSASGAIGAAETGAIDATEIGAEQYAMHGLTTKALGSNMTNLLGSLLGGAATGGSLKIGSLSGLLEKGSYAADSAGLEKTSSLLMKGATGAEDMGVALAGLGGGPLLAIGAAAVGLGLLVDKIYTAKTSTQQLMAQFQALDSTATVSGVFSNIPKQINQMGNIDTTLTNQLKKAAAANGGSAVKAANQNSPVSMGRFGPVGGNFTQVSEQATNQTQAAAAARQLAMGYINTSQAVSQLAHNLGVSYPTAVAIADAAGLHMNKTMTGFQGGLKVATQEAKNYETALGQMGTGMVAVYNQLSKVENSQAFQNAGKVNSVFDTAVSATAAPSAALSSIYSALGKTPTGGTADMIKTTAAITSGLEPMIDAMRTAASVGAVSGKTMSKSYADAAASILPLVGNNKAALAAVLQLANEGGGHFTSAAQLIKAAGGSVGQALKNLNNDAATATAGLAKLGTLGQQVANDMQSKLASSIANVANKYPNLKSQIASVIATMNQWGPSSSQAQKAEENLAKAMASSGATYKQVNSFLQAIGSSWRELPNGQFKQNTFQTNVITKQITETYTEALNASMAGTTNLHLSGHASGTQAAPAGWAWVGEKGPELMQFVGGERVLPHPTSVAVSRGYANGVGIGGDTHVHVYMDGKEVTSAVKSQVNKYNVRNGNRDSTGRPMGNFRPRG